MILDKWKVPKEAKGKIAALVLLKKFINSNERCHTTDAPSTIA